MQQKPISFLLGAGFSKPADYPLASEVNDRIKNLKESDITIHTSGLAWFNNGEPTPNDWFMRKDDRQFAEDLIRYYCTIVKEFDYEEFYDWYSNIRTGKIQDKKVDSIAFKFNRDTSNLLMNFNFTFNQLLAQLFDKQHPEIHLGRGLPRSHSQFLDLVDLLEKSHVVHLHSLNHDLFLESLSSTDAIIGELADGFSELGSPYYGKLETEAGVTYTVRLKYFANDYNSNINLYKLHGSIDHY